MEKIKLNALVDIILIVFFFILAFSGLTLGHIFPKVSIFQDSRELLKDYFFLGITRDYWAEIHDNLGEIILFFIIIHLILHLSNIKNLPKLIKRNPYIKARNLNERDLRK